MKLFGVDLARKWITYETDTKIYSIHFKNSLFKGIYDVSVWSGDSKSNLEIPVKCCVRSTYPPIKKLIKEIGLIIKTKLK